MATAGKGRIARERPAGLGGKDPPVGANAAALPPIKQKFFPIPIPREPEWVAGAHGDRISLGKTLMVLERDGGPEPPEQGRLRPRVVSGPAPTKRAPAVISKGFTANPNLVGFLMMLHWAEGREGGG